MRCGGCGQENREGRKFCGGCGARLAVACPSCGTPNEPDERFCGECGVALGAAVSSGAGGRQGAAGERSSAGRKVVSIIFADLVGSTALHERLDAESVRQFMESYYAAMRGAVEAHGGRVTQVMGDGVKAVFGAPRVAEDDAIRAVHAAVAMQEAFRTLAEQQRGRVGKTGLRVAVNTGEVVSDGEAEIIGDPVNVAARLQERGRDGDVVIGGSTQRLVAALVTLERLGSFALKGRSERVEAYRVVSLEPPAVAKAAAFVGRDEELARLAAVYETAVAKPAASLAVLLGAAGLGKSRLIDEFARLRGDAASVLMAHCEASGGATFAPLVAALRDRLDIGEGAGADALRTAVEAVLPGEDAERDRIAAGVAALLAGSPASPEETFFMIRRLLGALAAAKPLVLVIDDLQWAEPLLLDLIEHLVQWGSGVPLLVLVGARPELREVRSSLTVPGGFVGDVLTLAGLDAGAAMRLAAGVIGAADLPATVAAKVLATSEGNPLFVSELVRMLVQEGVLERQGERWVASAALAGLEMPPTIHALLAARIERLRPEERAVLERAAVVGRSFSRSAVATLLGREASDLDARFEALRRSELIERDTGWYLGEPVLRFHHVLVRDAAYRRLLKGTRAELHARLAAWIEAKVGDAAEHDETIGWHLEQAHQHLHELGPLDAAGVALGERAARRLAAAGRRALARDDVSVAASLLGRALDCLPAEASERGDLALDWCEALLSAGDVGPAAAAIDELARAGADSPRLRAWHTCFAGQLTALTAPEALRATADAVAAAAKELARLEDAAGEAKAHFVHAQALARLGKVGPCEAALDRALAAARRAGDDRRSNAVLAGAPRAALWGPSPVTRASGRCLDVVRVLRITRGAPAVEAVALSCQGVLEALRGRIDAAKRMIAVSRKMVEELGIAHRLFEADVFAGRVALLEGDATAAEGSLRGAYEGLRELGLGIDAAQAAALLARALLGQGRAAEADALSRESEALAGDDLQAAIAWRGARAEALAQRGEHAAAVELAQAAVEIAAATDALLDHADARVALAAALRAAGRGSEADAEERRAHELWETKGATLLAGHARAEGERAVSVEQPTLRLRRRVRPNAATAWHARVDSALIARDFDTVRAEFGGAHREIDHPSGSTYGRDGAVASLERLFRSHDPTYRVEPLATLGPSLLLGRRHWAASGASGRRYDVGAYENESFALIETDERGLCVRSEIFATDNLGDAVASLYEAYAELLPEGLGRAQAEATARSVATLLRLGFASDPEAFATAFDPELQWIDHKSVVGFGSGRGVRDLLRAFAAGYEVGEQIVSHGEDVLALSDRALLLRWRTAGVAREGGGPFEWPFLRLFLFDAEGRVARYELFDVEREAEALARFDALVGDRTGEPAAEPLGNAASRADDELMHCFNSRDWAGVEACLAPRLVFDERRRRTLNTVGKEEWLPQFRFFFDLPESRFTIRLLATRGERLTLHRHEFDGQVGEGGGPFELDPHVTLHEVDRDGRIVAIVLFDLDDLDAAHAEIDARFAAGEATAHSVATAWMGAFQLGFASRDWEALVALSSPALVAEDHRTVGWGTLQGPAAWVRALEALVALGPDVRLRLDHLRASERGLSFAAAWVGTREGGAFEIPVLAVVELDDRGRQARLDVYDLDKHVDARARFDAIAARPAIPATRFANAATRANEQALAVIRARDAEGFAALLGARFRYYDRTRLAQLDADTEQWLAGFRRIIELTSSISRRRVLATRGDRLALIRALWQGTGDDIGEAEIEWLLIIEVDGRADHVAIVRFDPDDEDAAYAELDARFAAGEGAEHANTVAWLGAFGAALERRDWDAVTALNAPSFVGYDHRMVGWGTRRGSAAFLEPLRAMVELAPDARMRAGHVRTSSCGYLTDAMWVGTRDGGPFESPFLGVTELGADGRALHTDFYDPEHLDAAFARFDEIRASEQGDPHSALAKTNVATAAMARWQDTFDRALEADDWERMRALCEPDLVVEDRTRFAQLAGDLDFMIASLRARAATGARPERTVIGSAGDRIAIWRMLWTGGPPDARFEIEYFALSELGDSGLAAACLLFDDARAAQREAWARWAAIDPAAAAVATPMGELVDAFNAHDRDRWRAQLADEIVVDDHRRTGMGRLEGADAWADSLVALWELAPETKVEAGWHWSALDRHGAITVVRRAGVLPDGGDFESEYLNLYTVSRGLITHTELFEVEDLDAALARFEELRVKPPR